MCFRFFKDTGASVRPIETSVFGCFFIAMMEHHGKLQKKGLFELHALFTVHL